MSNVQITKQRKIVITDKLNVNPPFTHEDVSLIFRGVKGQGFQMTAVH